MLICFKYIEPKKYIEPRKVQTLLLSLSIKLIYTSGRIWNALLVDYKTQIIKWCYPLCLHRVCSTLWKSCFMNPGPHKTSYFVLHNCNLWLFCCISSTVMRSMTFFWMWSHGLEFCCPLSVSWFASSHFAFSAGSRATVIPSTRTSASAFL